MEQGAGLRKETLTAPLLCACKEILAFQRGARITEASADVQTDHLMTKTAASEGTNCIRAVHCEPLEEANAMPTGLFPMPSEAFRQQNRKRRALSLFAFDSNRAPMFLDDPLDNSQP